MPAIYSLLILAAVSLPAAVYADNVSDKSATLPPSVTPKPLCEEEICSRLYWPVCSLVDGQQVTAPSPCVLNNKIRCTRMLRKSLGRKVPTVRFLHNGACSPESDRSIVVRARDAVDVASTINETSLKQSGEEGYSFEQFIDELIDEILYEDSSESFENDDGDDGSDADSDVLSEGIVENDEDSDDIIDGIIENDEDSDDITDEIIGGESIENDEHSDDIVDGLLESAENSDNGINNLEEIDEKEVIHRQREAKIDKSWLRV